MRRLLSVLVSVVVVLAAVELLAGAAAGEFIERRLREADTGARSISAEVSSFPMLTRLALAGRVQEATVEFRDLSLGGLSLAVVRMRLRDVRVDRSRLGDGVFRPTGLGRGTVSVSVRLVDIASAAGLAVELPSAVEVSVSSGNLVVGAEGIGEVSVPYPSGVLPCEPAGQIRGGRVRLSCSVDDVPALLQRDYPMF